MKQLITMLLAVYCLTACKEKTKTFSAPISDLGHIDFVLDSTAFHTILQDSFLRNEFAVMSQDTVIYSKPSYDIYLLGREAFLHISLAKENWENRAGSGVMIFQTRKSGKGDSLQNAWKQFYKDSLYFSTFKGDDFELEEITSYRKKDPSKPLEPNFTPFLTSFSTQTYKNWGYNDSLITNGLTMQVFMNSWDMNTQSKLFKKIKSLHLQLTQQEFVEMESALYAMGYSKQGEGFTHEFNPSIIYSITETNAAPKYTKIVIELAESTTERVIPLGNMYTIYVKDKELIIEASN